MAVGEDFVHLDRYRLFLHLLLIRLSWILFDHKFEVYLNKFKLQHLSAACFKFIYFFIGTILKIIGAYIQPILKCHTGYENIEIKPY